jgi:thiol-disulfide isomerase/thioredoxin
MNTSASIINVKTLDEYYKYLKSNTCVVANFSASFCKPCKEISPYIEELAANTAATAAANYPNIIFLKIDIEEGSEISDFHNISSIPYFKFYRDEIVVTSYCGTDKKIIQEALDNITRSQ